MPRLNKNSDNILELNNMLDNLADPPSLISGATVQLISLKDENGIDIVGISLPITMAEVEAGLYRGNLPNDANLDNTKIANGIISGDAGVDQHREWCITYMVVCRDS